MASSHHASACTDKELLPTNQHTTRHAPTFAPPLQPAGRNVESWKLADIKRDDYAPNTAGLRQWEGDRKRWQARRVADIAKDAGGWGGKTCLCALFSVSWHRGRHTGWQWARRPLTLGADTCPQPTCGAGYSAASVSLIEEVVLGRDIPDPRDIRRYDLVSPLGGINFKWVATLRH